MPSKFLRVLGFNGRRHKRKRSICLAKYSEAHSSKTPAYVNVLDISAGGLSIATYNQIVKPGNKIQIQFELDPGSKAIWAEGEAKHTRQVAENIYRTGIQFTNIAAPDVLRIKEYVSHKRK